MMYLNGAGLLIGILLYIALFVIGILIAYYVIKAGVRDGTIEAYIKLRREKLYPPE